jgi:hypothetical protein
MPTAPYDNLEQVVNTARVRLNDAIATINGDILTDAASFTLVAIIAAWRRFQETLVDLGFAALKNETVIYGVGPTTYTDLSNQVSLSWSGYFNGSTLNTSVVLPGDFIFPYDLWERPSGGSGSLQPMDQCYNGLPNVSRSVYNRIWEWREQTIYMPGATGSVDLRIRYAAFMADFVASGTTAFSAQPVPIMRALNPLAWFICTEIAKARGDLDAGDFETKALLATQQAFYRDQNQGKSIYSKAQLGKMPDQYTPMSGPNGPRWQEKQ